MPLIMTLGRFSQEVLTPEKRKSLCYWTFEGDRKRCWNPGPYLPRPRQEIWSMPPTHTSARPWPRQCQTGVEGTVTLGGILHSVMGTLSRPTFSLVKKMRQVSSSRAQTSGWQVRLFSMLNRLMGEQGCSLALRSVWLMKWIQNATLEALLKP